MPAARKTLVDFLFVLGGKFSNLTVVLLGGLLVARAAGPAEYGIFVVAMSLVLLGDGLLGAPLDLAAVRFFALHSAEPGRVRGMEAMALQLKILLAALAFLGVCALRPLLALQWPAVSDPSFPLLTCGIALTSLLMARSTATCLQNRREFRLYSAIDFLQGMLRAGGFIVLAWLGRPTAASFIGIYALAAAGAAAGGWCFLGQWHLFGRWPGRADALRLMGYCGYTGGIVALGTITGRGDMMVLALQRGTGGSAAYGMASQLAQLLTQVAMYASVLTQPRILGLERQGRLRGLLALNLVVVGCVGLLVMAVGGPWSILPRVLEALGPGFSGSAPLLRILLLGVVLDWVLLPLLMVYCLQVCPREAFLGEIMITVLFAGAVASAVAGVWSWPIEPLLAVVAVLGRAAKLVLYLGLFLRRHPQSPPGTDTTPTHLP